MVTQCISARAGDATCLTHRCSLEQLGLCARSNAHGLIAPPALLTVVTVRRCWRLSLVATSRRLESSLQVDDLDFAIRKKSPEKAAAAYAEAKSALDAALAALG